MCCVCNSLYLNFITLRCQQLLCYCFSFYFSNKLYLHETFRCHQYHEAISWHCKTEVYCVGVQALYIADKLQLIIFESEAGSDVGYCLTEHKSSFRPKSLIEYPDRNHEVRRWQGEPSKQDRILINAHYHSGSHPSPLGNFIKRKRKDTVILVLSFV